MDKLDKQHETTNKFIQELIDLLVKTKEAHHKLVESNNDINDKIKELQWEVSCLKPR